MRLQSLGRLSILILPSLASHQQSQAYAAAAGALLPPSDHLLANIVANMTNSRLAPVIALSHGGGPMPLLGDPKHAAIVKSLRTRVPELLRLNTPEEPKAIVLVTAHWSEDKPTISAANKHALYYDYYGFPKETYEIQYEAEGSPEVAKLVEKALKEEGLDPKLDMERGWDHGVFVPLLLINPKAHIPVIQLSVLNSEDPSRHFAMGRALHTLRSQNIAIIGSGFASIHNLRLMFSSDPALFAKNAEWNDALTAAVLQEMPEEREEMLTSWRQFPSAYDMHPRGGAEHFMPLIVCAGAGGEGKAGMYKDDFAGWGILSYYWE